MGEETGRKGLIIFVIFLVASIILLFYIILFSINQYNENRLETDTIAETSYECTTYIFDVYDETISYEGNVLNFEIKNTIGEEFHELIVSVNRQSGQLEYNKIIPDFRTGKVEKITLTDIENAESFSVYPKRCPDNQKTYSLVT